MQTQRVLVVSIAALAGLTAATASCASSPRLEAPVGAVHTATPPSPPETDIFAEQYADTDLAAFDDFRDALAGYGAWVSDPRLGTVWIPSRDVVGSAFVPYATAGHWTWGQREWVWVSDYVWGWVAFHYWRWVEAGARGWAWVPGRRYAGAWVSWRTGTRPSDGKRWVGWGPVQPTWYWKDGEAVRTGRLGVAGFVYCPSAEIFARPLTPHFAGPRDAVDVAIHTTPFRGREAAGDARSLAPMPEAPTPDELGVALGDVLATPNDDPNLQRAWLLARPSAARAAGYGPRLEEEHLKEWVAGSPRWIAPGD